MALLISSNYTVYSFIVQIPRYPLSIFSSVSFYFCPKNSMINFMYASRSSQNGMWLLWGNVYHRTLGMCQKSCETTSSVASSNRPLSTSVGTAILCSSGVMSQCLSEPVVWNSDAPILPGTACQQKITVRKGRGAHRLVHRRVSCLVLEGAQELDRPRIHPQDELLEERHNRRLVLWVVRRARLLVLLHHILHQSTDLSALVPRARGGGKRTWMSCGSSVSSLRADMAHISMLASESESTSRRRPRGRCIAMRAPSMPPHECPSTSYSSMPRCASRLKNSSSKSCSVQKPASPFFSGRCVLRPAPIWS